MLRCYAIFASVVPALRKEREEREQRGTRLCNGISNSKADAPDGPRGLHSQPLRLPRMQTVLGLPEIHQEHTRCH